MGEKITGVVPWPAVLAPGDEVAKVIAKTPFNLAITKIAMSVKRGLYFFILVGGGAISCR